MKNIPTSTEQNTCQEHAAYWLKINIILICGEPDKEKAKVSMQHLAE